MTPETLTSTRTPLGWNTRLLSVVGLLGLVLIYGRGIILDPILERDDKHTLLNLKSWDTLRGFLQKRDFESFAVYQPFRDLTLHLDLYLKAHLGFGTFHLSNFLLFLGILWIVYRILSRLHSRRELVLSTVMIFAFHPVFVGSVAWVSARKHLLSFFFILLATSSVTKVVRAETLRWRTALNPAILYLLSLLSHPINVFWPLWALAYWNVNSSKKSNLLPIALCFPPLLFGMVANLLYYTGLYELHTSAHKLVGVANITPGIFLLEQGRYLFNFVFPVRLAALYSPGSTWNLVGLGLAGVLVFSLFRTRRRTESLLWLLFYLLPLSTVAFTNVFVSDTYALASAFALMNILVILLSEGGVDRRKLFPAASLLIAVILGVLSYLQAGAWLSDAALWKQSYRAEPTPRTVALHADQTLRAGDLKGAMILAAELKQMDPNAEEYSQIAVRAIFLDSSTPIDARIRLIQEFTDRTPWTRYFVGLLHAKKGDFSQAFNQVREGLKTPNAFLTELPIVAAEGMYLCRRSGRTDCFLFSEEIKNAAFSSNWNEDVYQGHLKELTEAGSAQ